MKKFKGYGFTLCVTAFLLVGLVGCDGTQTTSSTTQDETVKYTVEFMDGETVLYTEEVEEGDKVTEYTPDVDGKEFLGWFIEPTFIHEFDFDTPITKDTQIFGSFVTYTEDTRTWQILGAGKSNLLRKSNWGAGNTEEHLLTKQDVENKNVFTITTDLYVNDEFQFAKDKEFWENTFSSVPSLSSFSNNPQKTTSTLANRKTFELKNTKNILSFCKENSVFPPKHPAHILRKVGGKFHRFPGNGVCKAKAV